MIANISRLFADVTQQCIVASLHLLASVILEASIQAEEGFEILPFVLEVHAMCILLGIPWRASRPICAW